MKKFLICLMALVLVFAMVLPFASCKAPVTNDETTTAPQDEPTEEPSKTPTEEPSETPSETPSEGGSEDTTEEPVVYLPLPNGTGYTYKDSVTVLSSNWNTHTYQTTDESYPVSFLTTGLYGFFFNDEEIYKSTNGSDPYAGYVIAPEMAAELPVDITEEVKAAHPEFNIPSEATAGYAYKIALNPNATWENGEAINADTYVYSMEQLLNPVLMNYRGPDYFDGDFAIANARNYYYQGTTNYTDNGNGNKYALADLVKREDGNYYTADGNAMYIAVYYGVSYLDGNSLGDYADAYGAESIYGIDGWNKLVEAMNDEGMAVLNDETYAALLTTIGADGWGNEDESYAFNYFLEEVVYEDNYDFANVGIYKTGEYEIVLVLEKSLSGFYLLYNLTGNWIVYQPYYEAGKKQIGDTDAWTNSYCSDLASTMSYGPYKMTEYQSGKYMKFEKNDNWFGYTDGKHIYVDPVDGETYTMYQTDSIVCQVVAESSTRKLMFLKGELMGYGLQSADFAEYRNSDRAYVTPSETIFFLIFNGYMDAIKEREASEGFDTTKYDLETMTLNSFRRAFAVTYDKENFATTISPSRSGGYGLIGTAYIYDPETGSRYRDTDQAKQALCDFYSVDVSKFESLDAAVDSITGYDPETAKTLFIQAYNEAIEAGYITDADGDGKSDQTVRIEYCSPATSDFMKQTLNYLNTQLLKVLEGTPFEGKIEIYESAPYGNEWSNIIKAGMSDTVLAGWQGSALNPFSLTDLYTNPSKQYDAKWFNSQAETLTLTIDGEEITMNLKQWSDALNGTAVTVNEKQYNFGDGKADVNTRLNILAAIETKVLGTYNYIPMLQDGSVALLSKQVFYVVDEYNPIMGRGGIAYMKYNYNDSEWIDFVNAQEGGVVKY
ncbi:MAG: hypothetical protein IKA62_06525 [Clostridia bacterium]|nr:hypothetical protein [Clostridia bacterium]